MPARSGDRTLLIGAVALAAALMPRRALDRLPTICPVRLLTGYPCPTCGMTRSWHSVARLDPGRAVREHPFGPVILAAIATGAWSPTTADAVTVRLSRLPTGVKVVALAGWLGWWASRLLIAHRLKRV